MNLHHSSHVGPGLRASGCVSLVAIGLALVAGAPAAQAAFPGANGQLAFESYSSSHNEGAQTDTSVVSIDVASPGGGGRRSLRTCMRATGIPDQGDCSIEYGSPAWSPRGSTLAFDAGARLGVMRGDGTGFYLLAQQTASDGEPAWSPNGTQLVFSGAVAGEAQSDLYVLDLASGRSTRLTFRGGRSPAWSSSGRIAFTRGGRADRSGTGDVYTVRPDGGGLRRITHLGGSDPAWSPYATKLAFIRKPPRGAVRLYVAGADGRGLRRLTTHGADDPGEPSWSPDGKQIAYTSFEGVVSVQRLDGTGLREVARGSYSSQGSVGGGSPDWQPVGRR